MHEAWRQSSRLVGRLGKRGEKTMLELIWVWNSVDKLDELPFVAGCGICFL